MSNLIEIINEMKADFSRLDEKHRHGKIASYEKWYFSGHCDCLEKYIPKLTLLLQEHESNHNARAHCANTMNGDVPHVNGFQKKYSAGAGVCETGSERQNEQTKKVCRHSWRKSGNGFKCLDCGKQLNRGLKPTN